MSLRKTPFVLLLSLAPLARADTVVLKDGKKIENVVVSQEDQELVVINRWNSRIARMRFEIPASDILPRSNVAEVILADPPLEEYRRRASRPGLTAELHFQLARFCGTHEMKAEEQYHLEQALTLDPSHERALASYGAVRWNAYAVKNPRSTPAMQEKEREFIEAGTASFARAKLAELATAGMNPSTATLIQLERTRRSMQEARGLRPKQPLTVGSAKLPGVTYCLFVPRSYDARRPTPLVIGLHAGSMGGKEKSRVTGSGEEMMTWLQDSAESWDMLCACPTAIDLPWDSPSNTRWIEALVDELMIRFNVDRTRVYLAGYSIGGYGAWTLAQRRPEKWAACASLDGGGEASEVLKGGVPIYIFHGSDDPFVRVDPDRDAARALLAASSARGTRGPPVDFVYTEIDGVGHDIPKEVRNDVFRWFAGRARPHSRKGAVGPDSSFDAKVTKEEVEAFGDPAKPGVDAGAPSGDDALAELQKGGAAGQSARATLGARKDEATARAIGALLKSKKSSAETRLLAVQTLGDQALAGNAKLIAPAIDDDDSSVLDAAIDALGKVGGKDAIEPLKKAAARLAKRFDASVSAKRSIARTDYATNLASCAILVRALEQSFASGAAGKEDLVLLVESAVVAPVFLPAEHYTVDSDRSETTKGESGKSRLDLARAVKQFLVAVKDPRGRDLLVKIRNRWHDEVVLGAVCDQGIAAFDR